MPQFCIFVADNSISSMKKLFLLSAFIVLAFSSFAQHAWTISAVPNTRLQSNDIHVSDPDDYLSDSAEMNINTALCAIRDKADVFVVTLASIGEVVPKRFATELFNHWGIGDAETDNGVLLLFVEDQHALEFETGYGAEATLTDARCERIFTQTIVPFFKQGDYEGGLCSGVAEIVAVYGGEIPMGLKTTLPAIADKEKNDDDLSVIFGLFAIIVAVLPIVGIVFWARKRKEKKTTLSDSYQSDVEDGITYINGSKTTWSGSPWEGKGCLGGMMLGLSILVFMFIAIIIMTFGFPDLEQKTSYNWICIIALVLYVTWICFRHNHRALKMADTLAAKSINPKSVYKAAFERSGPRIATWMAPWLGWVYYLIFKKKIAHSESCSCPTCGGVMNKYNSFSLPENHVAEEHVKAFEFTPYRCGSGHVIVVKEHGSQYSKFKKCSKCGAYTSKLMKTETIKEADYNSNGEKKETYECLHCGDIFIMTVVIPKLVHYYSGGSSSSSSSSGRSYSSSSHSSSSGGSFGGGSSGGGGYSGRW